MIPLNCIIVDDEPLAQEVIERYVGSMNELNLLRKCSNALEAFEVLHTESVDLIFLDISMPVISGIDFLRSIKYTPSVIITTAYPDFALQGYELDVADYLVKPVSMERFMKAVNKVIERKKNTPVSSVPAAPKTDFMFVKSEQKLVKVKFSEIEFIEGMKDYVKIFTKEKVIITLMTMKFFEANLPPGDFIRIHKSYIINVDAIKSISGHEVEMKNTKLPIGSMYKDNLLKRI
jgi:DNA-binding LytR/AlgR family response regulator